MTYAEWPCASGRPGLDGRRWSMALAPRSIVDSVVQTVCGRSTERLLPLSGGGMNETYRADLQHGDPVIVRIARHSRPWFEDEAHLVVRARAQGVPAPEVLGVEHVDRDGELLSFSIQRFQPGRPLNDLGDELSPSDRERFVIACGELLARIHTVVPGRGMRHPLRSPQDQEVARVVHIVSNALGAQAAAIVDLRCR